ncbi:MAG: pyridoxal-phosphate dependent enzyme, partial [Pseudomonadota bacterium]
MAERPMICLYCGSRPGHDAAFAEAAVAVGSAIAARGWGLVYGAGDHGLMGLTAQAAMEGGAPVLGFIPRRLVDLEVAKRDITAMVITETMHERKKLMLENADAVFIPIGGGGLAAGVATAVRAAAPSVKIIGVEPEQAASMQAAFNAGGPVTLDRVGI